MWEIILSTPADINMCDCAVGHWQRPTCDEAVIRSGTQQCDV